NLLSDFLQGPSAAGKIVASALVLPDFGTVGFGSAAHVAGGRGDLMASLLVLKGNNQGQRVTLGTDKSVLGRNPDCQVVISGTAVSREHAQIVYVQGKFYIEDKQSRNGTFVNNQQINGRTLLQEGDRIKICDALFTFHDGGPTKPPLPIEP